MSDFDKEVAELLYRVDERTARMDEQIHRMEQRLTETNIAQNERVKLLEEEYESLDRQVQRNTTVISGYSVGVGAVLTALAAKLADLLNWI